MKNLLFYATTFGLLILLNFSWVSAQQRQQDVLPDSVKTEQGKQISNLLKGQAVTERRRISESGYSEIQTGRSPINIGGTIIDFYYPMLPKGWLLLWGFNPSNPQAIEKCKAQNANLVTTVGTSATTRSTRLNNFINLIGQPIVNYNDTNPNRVFGDSFKLKGCKVCYAEMEIQVAANKLPNANDFQDDALYIGGTSSTFLPYSIGFPLWQPNNFWNHTGTPIPANYTGLPKTLTFQLPTILMNNLAWNGQSVDLYVHDDTRVRQVTLRVWYE